MNSVDGKTMRPQVAIGFLAELNGSAETRTRSIFLENS